MQAKYQLNNLEERLNAYTFVLLTKQHKAMKENELTKTQPVTKSNKANDKKADSKKAVDKPAKAPKARAESMEKLAERLLKEKASEAAVTAAFRAAYQAKGKKVTDEFLSKRIKIYQTIASKRAAAKVTK